MKSLLILCAICIALLSCKIKTQMPNFKIRANEISENSFVLEKEEDVAKIGKDYIIYIERNSGSRKMNKVCDCTELEEKYILFKANNRSYIQKIAGKAVYYPQKLKSNDIIDLYVDSFSNLKNERVKKFRTMQGDNIFAFHRTFKQYILIVEQDKPITINFHEEDFQKEGFGEKNVNYPYNKNLLFYKIDRLLNSEIDKLNKRDAFVFRTCRKD